MNNKKYITDNKNIEVYSIKKDVDFFNQCLFKILTYIHLFVNIINSYRLW